MWRHWKGAGRPGPSGKGRRGPASTPLTPIPRYLGEGERPPKRLPDLAFEMEPAELRMKDRPQASRLLPLSGGSAASRGGPNPQDGADGGGGLGLAAFQEATHPPTRESPSLQGPCRLALGWRGPPSLLALVPGSAAPSRDQRGADPTWCWREEAAHLGTPALSWQGSGPARMGQGLPHAGPLASRSVPSLSRRWRSVPQPIPAWEAQTPGGSSQSGSFLLLPFRPLEFLAQASAQPSTREWGRGVPGWGLGTLQPPPPT